MPHSTFEAESFDEASRYSDYAITKRIYLEISPRSLLRDSSLFRMVKRREEYFDKIYTQDEKCSCKRFYNGESFPEESNCANPVLLEFRVAILQKRHKQPDNENSNELQLFGRSTTQNSDKKHENHQPVSHKSSSNLSKAAKKLSSSSQRTSPGVEETSKRT